MELTDQEIADRWWKNLKADTTYINGHMGLRRAWDLARKHNYDPAKIFGDDVYQLWRKKQEL